MARTGSGQLVSQRDAMNSTRALLEKMEGQFQSALPRHMNGGQFVRMALTSLQRNPKLLECSKQSFLGALVECAQTGLAPNAATGEAYLVPYKNTCTLIVGYKGLMKLSYRSGLVDTIYADVVYEEDEYEFDQGSNPFVKHKRSQDPNRGKVIAAYASARLKQGGSLVKWLWADEVEAFRQRSMAKNNGPWVTDWNAMAMKTAVRRLATFLPMTPELERAMAFSEAEETGRAQEFVIDLTDGGDQTIIDAATGEVVEEKPAKPKTLQEAMGGAKAGAPCPNCGGEHKPSDKCREGAPE